MWVPLEGTEEMKCKKGDEVVVEIRGASITTYEHEHYVTRVSKGKVYLQDFETPFDAETRAYGDNGVIPGFSMWLRTKGEVK